MGEEMADSILRTSFYFHGKCMYLLHAAKLRHGTEGRHAVDFYVARKNLTASAGFELANSGTRGQHANH
jgi:hypothetical protein